MLKVTSPLISIGLPIYQRTQYIEKALQSCLEQEYQPLEILVSDDSQHDEIQTITKSFKSDHIQYLKHPHPYSLIDKFNELLHKAQGTWMLFLCDDDFLERTYLKTMVKHLQENPDAVLVRSHYRLIDSQGKTIRTEKDIPYRLKPIEFLNRVFHPDYKMNISGVMFPRELLIQQGGFARLATPWDSDRLAWVSLASQGPFVCDPEALCNLRIHEDTITSRVNSDCEAFIKTSLDAHQRMKDILDGMSGKLHSTEEKKSLESVRQALDDYTQKQLVRALDHGMLCALDENTSNAKRQLQKLYQRMTELKVPPFSSIHLYRCLSYLPHTLRSIILKGYKQYKIKQSIF